MPLTLLIPPSAKAVSLDAVKRHLRIETADDDTYLDDLIDACTAHLEQVSGRKLIHQTWRQYFDCAPGSGAYRLDVEPVQAVTDMRVYDDEGAAITVSPLSMELDAVSSPPRLHLSETLSTGKDFNGIEIDIVAGYGETSIDIPDALRRALLLLIAHAYEFRGAVPLGQQPADERQGFRTLLAPFVRMRI